jgi:hypothetical protein
LTQAQTLVALGTGKFLRQTWDISETTNSYGNFDQEWDHGIDIATLIKKIEDGDF